MNFRRSTARRILAVEPPTSRLSEGRSFVYVLPCVIEDWLKLGFSRDPLQRVRALHPRWFEFFDLDRGLLIETETVRDARRLERLLADGIREHAAPMPLTIREQAGGETEWYRGAYQSLRAAAEGLRGTGFTVHEPLRTWLTPILATRSDHLFAWAEAWLVEREATMGAGATVDAMDWELRHRLDELSALEIPVEPALPAAAWNWYCGLSDPF